MPLRSLQRRSSRLKRLLDRAESQQHVASPERRPFTLDWVRAYLPHYVTVAPSVFHIDLVADLGTLHQVRGQRRIYRGPRGSGKTSYLSKAYPLWAALEGVEPLTLLMAETGEGQAEAYLHAIKSELEANPAIRRDYPHAAGIGPRWTHDTATLRNGCTIRAKGSGGRLLGMADKNQRPTLVIGDDLNARSDAYSPTTRNRRLEWFNTDVMSIGTLKGTNYVIAGTSIHRDAVVCALARDGAWHTRAYKSILAYPTDEDLWSQWQARYTNLADADRAKTALEYYEANRTIMDAGAAVLWPEWESLYELMVHRATIGPAAFDSEKQDTPGVDGATEFPAAWLDHAGFFFADWPAAFAVKVVACDPSKGSDARVGDYQAIVSVGLHSDGVFYLDASLKREPVTIMAERLVAVAKEFRADAMAIETNATLGLLLPEVQRAMATAKLVCPLKGIHNTLSKSARIRRLGAWLSNKQIRVRDTPGGRELVEQLRQFPSGEFDDAIDAAEIGIRTIEELVDGNV